ncbi:MAG: type II toxin-antitoxin system HicA family toxin [Polyangiaceae bacterium]
MRRVRDPKNWRDLRYSLGHLGAAPIRVCGSHEKWRFQDGETFTVVINHLADPVPIGILVKYRRLRERRCAQVGEEPAPLELAGSW